VTLQLKLGLDIKAAGGKWPAEREVFENL
jgi:hypothetical protein